MAKKVDMRVIKEILEIYEKNSNLSYRKIALMCGCSKNTGKTSSIVHPVLGWNFVI